MEDPKRKEVCGYEFWNFICLFISDISLFCFRLCIGWFLLILRQEKEELPRNPSSSQERRFLFPAFFKLSPSQVLLFYLSLSHQSPILLISFMHAWMPFNVLYSCSGSYFKSIYSFKSIEENNSAFLFCLL